MIFDKLFISTGGGGSGCDEWERPEIDAEMVCLRCLMKNKHMTVGVSDCFNLKK